MNLDEVWDVEAAQRYDTPGIGMFAPEVLEPAVNRLAAYARDGRALEFAIGTGRVAVPLVERGVSVTGIELSRPMIEQLRTKVDEATVPVVEGDMATTRAPGEFSLVYLVFNTISNLLTQAEQVACFRNAARHLSAGGRFVIELWVPDLRRLPPGHQATVFECEPGYIGLDTFDVLRQQVVSHHFRFGAGKEARLFRSPHRYIWPAELDLMAQLAGFELESRHADWTGTEFTAESRSHVSVYRIPRPRSAPECDRLTRLEGLPMRIHLDTDLGSDPDDLCALALLLSWPDVEITGITTNSDLGGRRAVYVQEALRLAGRSDISVAAGPDSLVPGVRYPVEFPNETRYWGRKVDEAPSERTVVEVIDRSVSLGAIIVCVGPLTNLAAYDMALPGRLGDAPIVLMGGFTQPLGAGSPAWDIDADWNLQYDVPAAEHVLRRLHPTLVPIEVTVRTGITRRDAALLDGAGPLPSLMARQALAYLEDRGGKDRFAEFVAAPTDLLNFHHDPLACAVALGWGGVTVEDVALALELRDTYLSTRRKAGGRMLPVVAEVDGDTFNRMWLDCILEGPLTTK